MNSLLKTLALTVGVLFALGVVLTTGNLFFFGSSKVRTLFTDSANALEGSVEPRPVHRDAGLVDAGAFDAGL